MTTDNVGGKRFGFVAQLYMAQLLPKVLIETACFFGFGHRIFMRRPIQTVNKLRPFGCRPSIPHAGEGYETRREMPERPARLPANTPDTAEMVRCGSF